MIFQIQKLTKGDSRNQQSCRHDFNRIYISITIVFLFLFFASCSTNESSNLKIKDNQAPKELKIDSGYKYEALDVSELYSNEKNDILKEIDLSTIKNIETSLEYANDRGVYVKKSPLEIYELLSKKSNKRTIKDDILFLDISLRLGKDKHIDSILKKLRDSSLSYLDLKNIDRILSQFNLFKKEVKFFDYRVDLLLKDKKSIDKDTEDKFLRGLKIIERVSTLNLLDYNSEKYFNKFFKIDKFNSSINQKFIQGLISLKKYNQAEKFTLNLLLELKNKDIKYDKSSLLNSLVEVYNLNDKSSKIKDLYLSNADLPGNKTLFYQYISYLKKEKIWTSELKIIVKDFNKTKSLLSFYRYYFSLKYESKPVEFLLVDYYNYLLKTPNDKSIKEYSNLLISNGKYKLAYQLLNISLMNNKKSEYYDDYIISMSKVISHLPYDESPYSGFYFFSTPDFIGGVLSLIQNHYKDNNFLTTIDNQYNINQRVEDMEFLFDTMKDSFKSTEKFTVFIRSYFDFLIRYNRRGRLEEVISLLQKSNKDIYFKLFLSKYIASQRKAAAANQNVYDIYMKILKLNKNNKDKFSKYLSETLNYLYYFKLTNSIKKAKNLVKLYPNNELIYEKLLYLLDSYRAYNDKIEVYETALKKFNKKTWSNKYSRFLIRRKMNNKMISLNKKLINLLDDNDYKEYLTSTFSNKKYGGFDSPFNKLYEKIYIDALAKYPFNTVILDKLLNFYNSFRFSYRYKSYEAINKYAKLLYKYIYINDDYRDRYFRDKKISKNMDHDKIIDSVSKRDKKGIPDLKYLAYMYEFRGEYEKSVKYYSILAKYYITDDKIIYKTAKLYKSLASSFYINDPSFLKKSEVLYQRLSFLYRSNSKYYISLAELYYELMLKDKAQKTLFRALEYEKGNESKYIDIANMFYDYYDYDNALKTVYSYRERKNNKDLLIPFVGRLLELKKMEKLAISEYFRDLLNKNNDSYQSQRRLKSLYNKKSLRDLIVLRIEENILNIINDKKLFYRFRDFFNSINNQDLIQKLETSLFENSKDLSLLKNLYYVFKSRNDKRTENLLKKLEILDPNDNTFNMIISYYKEKNNINEVNDYYVKLLSINSYGNDKYTFFNILGDNISFLLKNKRYEDAISKYEYLLTYIKKDSYTNERLSYKLKIARIYKQISAKKYFEFLLKLDTDYPSDKSVSQELFSYYKTNNKVNEMVNYLSKLIDRTKKDSSLNFYDKKYRVAEYRELLIQQFISLKRYSSVLDQYIEVLNRDPLDIYMTKKVYSFAKVNKIESRLLNYYEKLSKKSFKNHKYLLLNAKLYSLEENYNKALSYFEKAQKIEPQKVSIKIDIAKVLVKLNKYRRAYDIYNNLYLFEKNTYTKDGYLKEMFKISVLMKDIKLITELAYKVAGKINNGYYGTTNTLFVAKYLYEHNYLDLSRNYYSKIILRNMEQKLNLNSSILYQYSRTFIDKGAGVDLMKNVIELVEKLRALDRSRYRYLIASNRGALLDIISDYIPDNISYFSESEISLMNEYIKGVKYSYKQEISPYFLKLKMFKEYLATLSGRNLTKTKYNFYKSKLMFGDILSQGLYKIYDYRAHENVKSSLYRKAFISYTWGDRDEAFRDLESGVKSDCIHSSYGVAVSTYIDYLRKNNMLKYKGLVKNTCLYNSILNNYIKYKEKQLALELIDNQRNDKLWKLKEKANLYWRLEEFNQDGIMIYNELLGVNLSIKDQMNNEHTVSETEWNKIIKNYSKYILKSDISDIVLSDYINNIIEISPKSQKAYLAVADIYFNNKKYKKSIEYLKYASKLRTSSIINIKLIKNYLSLNDLSRFKSIKNKILKSDNLNDFSKLYNVLLEYKKLDGRFISSYNDLLFRSYKKYGYYKLRNFITQVFSYYKDKPITQLITFANNFDSSKYEIYKTLLFDKEMDFSNDYKLKLFQEIINYYSDNKDLYSQRTWVLGATEFLLATKKYDEASGLLSKYKELFVNEDKIKYNFYEFKVQYSMNNINKSIELLEKGLKYNYYEFSASTYIKYILENKDFSKKFLIEALSLLKESNKVNFYDYLKVLDVLDVNNLRTEIMNIVNTRTLSVNDSNKLEELCLNKGFNDLYTQILNNKYQNYYMEYSYKQTSQNVGDFYIYVLDLIKLNKQDKLKEAFENRKLSIKEMNLINDKIGDYSKEMNNKILANLISNHQDILYIKSLINYKLANYEKALSSLNQINVNNDYKYKIILKPLEVKILHKLNKLSDSKKIKEAIELASTDKELKLILFEYYLQKGDKEKAFYILGELGLKLYLSFDKLLGSDFSSFNIYNDRYYNNYDSYYDYYKPESLAKNALSKKEESYPTITNFIARFSKDRKLSIVKFLYEQYSKYSEYKNLGLAILYAYKELDKSYETEFIKLKKEKK